MDHNIQSQPWNKLPKFIQNQKILSLTQFIPLIQKPPMLTKFYNVEQGMNIINQSMILIVKVSLNRVIRKKGFL